MNNNRSIKTIADPEFIELTPLDINPLMAQCQIKVLYLGKNRNGSYIDKNAALEMSKTLRGCPIVGAYLKDKEDFGDHGDVITIEDGEIHFSCKTVPYGFVAPDARIWFQTFTDTDEFGNETEREYLLTTGYLWVDQYPEAQQVIDEGKGQSMELDSKNLEGHWATDNNSGMEFFIINDAVFSKLCILGDNVEPCFEGASITDVENQFSKDSEFTAKLFAMVQELNQTLYSKGGVTVNDNQETQFEEKEVETEQEVETQFVETQFDDGGDGDDNTGDDNDADNQNDTTDSQDDTQNDDDSQSDDDKDDDDDQDDDEELEQNNEGTNSDVDKGKKNLEQHTVSVEEFSAIQKELEELRAFKLSFENQQKDALIAKYHMLTDADKADIIAHKEEYSLDQIEEKLALIYVRKNVDFSTVDGLPEKEEEVEEESPLMSFSLDNTNNAEDAEDSLLSVLRLVKR